MFNIIEHNGGYAERTVATVLKSDGTLAIAVDFLSRGEEHTAEICYEEQKPYFAIDLGNMLLDDERITRIVQWIGDNGIRELHVAGNGLYSLIMQQHEVDLFVWNLLKKIKNHPDMKTPLSWIRNGGQTGIDEASSKAAYKLGINTEIIAAKGFLYRNGAGIEVPGKASFVARFPEAVPLVYPLQGEARHVMVIPEQPDLPETMTFQLAPLPEIYQLKFNITLHERILKRIFRL